MFFEVQNGGSEGSRPNPKKKSPFEQNIQGPASVALCLVVLVGSATLSLRLGNQDQGMTFETSDIPRMVSEERERITNDTHMPAQAKAIALGQIQAHLAMGKK
jgi:hypothetical protein